MVDGRGEGGLSGLQRANLTSGLADEHIEDYRSPKLNVEKKELSQFEFKYRSFKALATTVI